MKNGNLVSLAFLLVLGIMLVILVLSSLVCGD